MRTSRVGRALLGALGLLVATGSVAYLPACRSGTSAPPPAVKLQASGTAAPARTSPFLPAVHVLLDDPRLAAARTFERNKEYASAANAVAAARPENLTPTERCSWDYLEGRLLLLGGDGLAADVAFARAMVPGCPLEGYARLRSAQGLARAGHSDAAVSRASSVPDDLAASDEAKLVVADASFARGDRATALPIWRAWLAKNPRGNRWVDTSVKIAGALLDGIDGPPDTRAKEAFDLANKVVVEAPKFADSSGATALRARAVVMLRADQPSLSDALSDEEKAKQAQAWLDQGEPTKAFELASRVVPSTLPAPANGAAAICKAAMVRANAAAKTKVVTKGDVWADAVKACEKDEQAPNALYAAAKARGGKDPRAAIAWYGRIEQGFPAHRLADDARLKAALLIAQSSDEDREQRSEELLATLPDTYPAGDMKAEALFRAALGKMQRGDWAGATPLLDRIVVLSPDDRHWATAGRAPYFRARAAGIAGDVEDEKQRLVAIVQKHPLAYYMLLAHARLTQLDASLAARAVQEAEEKDRDAEATFPSKPHPVLASPALLRAVRLLDVGDVDAARREIAASGALADDADPEVVWSIGALYNQAGLPELGHAFARGRLDDHLPHYPEGKWRFPWEVAYPRAFAPLVVKACGDNGLPTSLAWAIMREESSFIADVRSHSNAFGLMQLIVPTAKWVAAGTPFGSDETALKVPETSIGLGTRLLSKLRDKHGHPALAIGAYNAGSGAVDRWMSARGSENLDLFVELVPYDETRNYIKRVLSSQAAYAYLYDPTSLKESFGLPFRMGR